MIELGIKSDPINSRYSFEWLFDLLAEEGVHNIQLGSFFELYGLQDDFFIDLKEKALTRGLRFRSVFTAYRELSGFFSNNVYLEKVARKNYERLIQVASLLEVDYCGSNPGGVFRDQMSTKDNGIATYLRHMKELMHLASSCDLRGLTIEPMSCLAEPPTLPAEMDHMLLELNSYHKENGDTTVPVYLCGDTSHGYVNEKKEVIFSSVDLFTHAIPYMAEFHFKNTDKYYGGTFGFTKEDQQRGIIDLETFRRVIDDNINVFPVKEVIGYLEINGPKIGRDYSDPLLSKELRESLRELRRQFSYHVNSFT